MIQKVYTEEWRPVVGYEGLYEVSNLGRVKSLDRVVNCKGNSTVVKQSKVLKWDIGRKGYARVTLSKENKVKRYLVHRLVAEVFLPNPKNLPEVNHKDEKKTNNAVWNLEWCDKSYNCTYNGGTQRRMKTRRDRGTAKTDPKPVVGVSEKDGSVIRFDSIMDATRAGFRNVCQVCQGIRPRAGGYKWFYA